MESIEQFDAAMQEEYWTVLQTEARGVMERLLNRAMGLERMAFLGVAPYERHAGRRGRRARPPDRRERARPTTNDPYATCRHPR